jgi:hypothetical protein
MQGGAPLDGGFGGAPPAAPAVPMPSPGLTPAGKLAIEPTLLPGETIQQTLTADGLYLGSHPFLKVMAAISGFMITITGGHIRINLVVTTHRVLVLQSVAMACGINKMKVVNAVSLQNITETGWAKETQMCCINSRMVTVQTKTQKHALVIKKIADGPLRTFMTQLSAVTVANAHSGTAT